MEGGPKRANATGLANAAILPIQAAYAAPYVVQAAIKGFFQLAFQRTKAEMVNYTVALEAETLYLLIKCARNRKSKRDCEGRELEDSGLVICVQERRGAFIDLSLNCSQGIVKRERFMEGS